MYKKHSLFVYSHFIHSIMNRNVPIFGFIIGLVFPVLGILTMYLIKFNGTSFDAFFSAMNGDHKLAAMVLSLSLLANIIPFVYYTNKRLDLTAKGILIATMLYALVIVLLRFVWN